MIPAYIPDQTFCTYFAAVALIGAGICHHFKNQAESDWYFVEHYAISLGYYITYIQAIADPFTKKGNEICSELKYWDLMGLR